MQSVVKVVRTASLIFVQLKAQRMNEYEFGGLCLEWHPVCNVNVDL